jgi:anti-sigma B factor antagonist
MSHASYAIEPRQQAGHLVLAFTGELDLAARELLLQQSEPQVGDAPLVLDFSNAQFVDASVVGVLFRLARLCRDHGGRLALVDAHASRRPIWRLTGYSEVCPLYESLQEAMAALAE